MPGVTISPDGSQIAGGLGDADGRTALERRHSVDGPPETADALGPVEAAREALRRRRPARLRHRRTAPREGPRCARRAGARAAGAGAARRRARRPPGRPTVAEVLERAREVAHRLAAVELEHERHVLEQQPADVAVRAAGRPRRPGRRLAGDAGRAPRLAEVLARETRRDEFGVLGGSARWPGDVGVQRDVGECADAVPPGARRRSHTAIPCASRVGSGPAPARRYRRTGPTMLPVDVTAPFLTNQSPKN